MCGEARHGTSSTLGVALAWMLVAPLAPIMSAQEAQGRWTVEKAQAWFRSEPWRVGTNYLPSHCGNVFDMFDAAAFDGTLMAVEREVRAAHAIGFTTLRVFLHEELYFHRGDAFLDSIDRLLDVFSRNGVVAMPVLFDAVWRPDADGAAPLPGVHNSAWVQCPTHGVLRAYAAGDGSTRERLQRYVTAVVSRFAADPRIAVWDIYNEASMSLSEHWILPMLKEKNGWADTPAHWLLDEEKQAVTLKLLVDAFAWSREVGPSQPLTSGVWTFPPDRHGPGVEAAIFRTCLDLSDVVSLHCYGKPAELDARLTELEAEGRPIMLTEFMARSEDSKFANILPVLRRHGAWGYAWGFVRGRSQTHRPWGSWWDEGGATATYPEWHHDLLYENGTAYDQEEVKDIWWQLIGSNLQV